MEILKFSNVSHVQASSSLDKASSNAKAEVAPTPANIKSIDVESSDVNMVQQASLQMQQADPVDLARVQDLKDKIASGELEFTMKDVARALVRS